MVDMALHQILPAALRYTRDLCETVKIKKELGITCRAESTLVQQLSETTDALYDCIESLRCALESVPTGTENASMHYRDAVVPAMDTLRV